MTIGMRPLAMVLCACAMSLAACAGGSSTTTSQRGQRATPSSTPSLTPGQDPLPAHDTPVDRAPAALAAVWKRYGVSLIPGHESLDAPPAAAALNLSGGALDDGQVQAVRDAVLRDQLLAVWVDEHDEVSLLPRVAGEPFLLGPVGVAVAEGTHVHTPPCGTLPTEIGVHAPDAALSRRLGAAGNAAVDATTLLVDMTFAGPCTTTGTTRDGHDVVVTQTPAMHILVVEAMHDDPLLGTLAYPEAGASCTDPRFSAACG